MVAAPRSSPCLHSNQYRIKVTNKVLSRAIFPRVTLILLCDLSPTSSVAIQTNNFRRLLHTVEALSELGPALAVEREFSDTSRRMLGCVMDAAGAREGALFLF